MEDQIVNWLKSKHKTKISVSELISAWQMTQKQKLILLGSMKHFKKLKRTYIEKDNQVQCCLVLG
ncbi:hypothetical protein [Enterococcus mundtii]